MTNAHCGVPAASRALVPFHKDLRLAGLLPPVDAPHHMRVMEWKPWREGVVLRSDPRTGSFVDVGLYDTVPHRFNLGSQTAELFMANRTLLPMADAEPAWCVQRPRQSVRRYAMRRLHNIVGRQIRSACSFVILDDSGVADLPGALCARRRRTCRRRCNPACG